MMKLIRSETIPKMREIFSRYPQPCFGIVGMTSNVSKRFATYNVNWQVYMRNKCNPYMDLDECILFRCWNKYSALKFEYLVQKSTIRNDGEFFKEFSTRMNNQTIRKPTITPGSLREKEYFVYLRTSRVPFLSSDIRKKIHPSDFESTNPQI